MQVDTFINEHELAQDAVFTDATLDGEITRQSGIAVHYGMLHARAHKQAKMWKLKKEVVEAKIYNKLKQQHADAGTKVTEAQLKNEVATHPDYIAVAKAAIEAEAELDKANQAVEAVRQKRDMMTQIAKLRIEEGGNTMSVTADEFAKNRMRGVEAPA